MTPICDKAMKFALLLLITYLAIIALIWSQQNRLLYPAPRDVAPLSPGFAEVSLKTDDGLALRAFYHPSVDSRPSIMYFHGNGGSLYGATLETKAFVSAGYGVLLVEYRGYGGNPGEPSERGLYRDGRAAMAFLAEHGIAPAHIVLIGNSLGSGVATEMAREFPVRALVLTAPYTSLQEVAAGKMRWAPVRWLMRDHFDNLAKIAQIDRPLLVLHGTTDTLIPIAHGRQLAQAAPHGTFMPFDGLGHDISFDHSAQTAIVEWLERLN